MTGRPTVALIVGKDWAQSNEAPSDEATIRSVLMRMRMAYEPRFLGRRLGLDRAFITGAIENDFVIFDPEPGRRHLLDAVQAFFEFKDASALSA